MNQGPSEETIVGTMGRLFPPLALSTPPDGTATYPWSSIVVGPWHADVTGGLSRACSRLPLVGYSRTRTCAKLRLHGLTRQEPLVSCYRATMRRITWPWQVGRTAQYRHPTKAPPSLLCFMHHTCIHAYIHSTNTFAYHLRLHALLGPLSTPANHVPCPANLAFLVRPSRANPGLSRCRIPRPPPRRPMEQAAALRPPPPVPREL